MINWKTSECVKKQYYSSRFTQRPIPGVPFPKIQVHDIVQSGITLPPGICWYQAPPKSSYLHVSAKLHVITAHIAATESSQVYKQ